MDFLNVDSDFVILYDDLAYREFIVCENLEGHKENVPSEIVDTGNKAVKQPSTKKEQFQKIIDFANVYNEDNTGKAALNELWEKIAVELNAMGPPTRTTMQWRRVWSVFKYNSKRAESSAHGNSSQATYALSQSRTRARGRSVSKGQRSADNSCSRSVSKGPRSADNSLQEIPTDERMLVQLGLLVQQNVKMIQNQEAILSKIDKSNEILATIAGKSLEQVSPVPFQSDQ